MFGYKKLIEETIKIIKTVNPKFEIPLNLKNSKETLNFLEKQLIKERENQQEKYNNNLIVINNFDPYSSIVSFGYYIGLPEENETEYPYIICLKYDHSDYWVEIFNSKIVNNNINTISKNIYKNINYDTLKYEGTLSEHEIQNIISFIKDDKNALNLFIKYITEKIDLNEESEKTIK